MRNLISFSFSRAVLSFCLATIKVSRHRASKLSFELETVSFSQKSVWFQDATGQHRGISALTVFWLVAVPAVSGVQKGSKHSAVALASWIAKQL